MNYIIQTKYTESGQCRLVRIKKDLKEYYSVFDTESELTSLVDKDWVLKNSSKVLNISVMGDKIVHKKDISEYVLSYWNYYRDNNQGKNTINRVLRECELEQLSGLKKRGYDSVIIYNAVVGMSKMKIIEKEILVFDESQIHIIKDNSVKTIGEPIYYHNTYEKFKRFDRSFIGTGFGCSYGLGFYFSSEPIKEYGMTKTVYLDINKPYEIKNISSFESVFKYIQACM